MSSRRELERALAALEGFVDPSVGLEQYATPATVAASLVHAADLHGDLARPVVDLGTGTGVLAIGAALRTSERVVGVDVDAGALAVAARNAAASGVEVDWVVGAVASLGLCPPAPVTVVMNPPFGAQRDRRGADRPFLEAASRLAAVSYSIHNAESRAFVEAYAAERGGTVTAAYALELDVPAQFAFHDRPVATVDAEAYRIAWDGP